MKFLACCHAKLLLSFLEVVVVNLPPDNAT